MQAINTVFTNLLNIGVGVAVTVAAFYLMWGAYMYMTASGNPHKMESGKSAMTNVAVGLCTLAQTDQGKNAARRAELEEELRDLGAQEDRLADAIADGLLSREAAQRKAGRVQGRRAEIYSQLDDLGREQEARERAIQYVRMAHTEGIGALVRAMPVDDRRRFFQAAFKSITLDGFGRGKWRTRSVKGYELSDPLNTFILQRASA